jgi:ribosome-associated protein
MARVVSDKKAHDGVALDMSAAVTYTDYFLICGGASTRQTKALAEELQRRMRARGVRPARVEGEREGEWILLDYLDVVVHIFTPPARDFYRLEALWRDVPRQDLPSEAMG